MAKAPKSKKVERIAVLDLETDPFLFGNVPRAFDAGFFDGINHLEWWGPDCCLELVNHLMNFDGICYAHNGGKFDFHFLIPFLPDTVDIFIVNGRILRLKFQKCVLIDSWGIIPQPLKSGGEKMEFAYWKNWNDCTKLTENEKETFKKEAAAAGIKDASSPREFYREEIIKYRRQDNHALFNLVTRFIKDYDFGLTIAGRAFNELKKLELKPGKGLPGFDAKFRPFYFGGRVQCFKPGISKGAFKVIDINSAYPAAMIKDHPWGLDFVSMGSLPKDRGMLERSFITLECVGGGVFPIRKKTGGLAFPTKGRFEFNVTGWEYLAGIETGRIKAEECVIKKVLVCYDSKNFKSYVNKFFAVKLDCENRKDEHGRLMAKLFLNSAYGKFAVNPADQKESKLLPIGEIPVLKEGEDKFQMVFSFDDWGFALWERPIKAAKMIYYNVATAASITGCVRAFLWRSLCTVKNPLYCDTDSITCSDVGDLKLSSNLGDWKLEAEGNSVAIAGKKLYSFRTNSGKFKTASKGVKISPEEIYQVASGEEIRWNNFAPSFSVKSQPKFISRRVNITKDF